MSSGHRIDGLVKSPSAALRFNFVVAAPKGPHSSVFVRLASGAFYETIPFVTFYEIIEIERMKINTDRWAAFILTLPVLLFLLAFFVYPLLYGLYLSLHSSSKGLANLQFIGLKNYQEILTSGLFWLGMKN
ncbi:MAG: sugar ABC transporter permease, partial [Deltaproteobacteria bacterium]